MTSTRSYRALRRNRHPALLASTLALAAACSTQEIEGPPVFEVAHTASMSRPAPFMLIVAPDAETPAELDQYYAGSTEYALRIDGQRAVREAASIWIPMEHIRAQWGPGGFVPAGAHVIQLVDQNGDVALETPPLDLQPDRANMVVVFGRRKALEHRFLTTDLDVPPGLVRLVALNLIRTGYAVEIVACSGDAVITCATTLAGPVAYGDAALADFREPARVPCNESIGAGITCGAGPWAAFRAVPSGGAGPSGSEAPLSNVRSGSDLGGLLDHPGAARIQLATPILIGPENGLTVGF